ncbi:restriction endonuclease [Geodermatophilus sp. SYSU D00814]
MEALQQEREKARAASLAAQAARERKLQENQRRIEKQRQALEAELQKYRKNLRPQGTTIDESVSYWLKKLKFPTESWNGVPLQDPRPVIRPELTKMVKKLSRPGEQIIGLETFEVTRGQVRVNSGRPLTYYSVFVFVTDLGFLVSPDQGGSYRVDRAEARAVLDLGLDDAATGPRPPRLQLPLAGGNSWSRNMLLAVWLQERLQEEKKSPSRAQTRRVRPRPQLIRDFNDSERVAAEWMSYFGYSNVGVMPIGPDGGVDIYSDQALAQVKAQASPTTRPHIQQHLGVCQAQGKEPVFFSLAGYTPGAVDWADANGMILFSFDRQGVPAAANTAAHIVMERAKAS